MSEFIGSATAPNSSGISTLPSSGGVGDSSVFTFGSDPEAYYQISLSGETLWPPLIAYVPEQFTLSNQAVFESRYSSGLGGLTGALQSFDNALKTTTGLTFVTKPMTLQTWVSTSPIEFNLPMLFNAQQDGLQEVTKPIAQLLALCSPSALDQPLSGAAQSQFGALANQLGGAVSSISNNLGQNLIRGPGPTFDEPTRGTYTLVIGNLMVFLNMLIVSVNAEYDSLVDQNGYPLSAKVDLTMRSSTVMLSEDIMQAFGFSS